MLVITEPWHPDGESFRATLRGLVAGRGGMKILAGAAIDDDHASQQHGDHALRQICIPFPSSHSCQPVLTGSVFYDARKIRMVGVGQNWDTAWSWRTTQRSA